MPWLYFLFYCKFESHDFLFYLQPAVALLADGGGDGEVCSGRLLRGLLARLLYTTAGPVNPLRMAVYYSPACKDVKRVCDQENSAFECISAHETTYNMIIVPWFSMGIYGNPFLRCSRESLPSMLKTTFFRSQILDLFPVHAVQYPRVSSWSL